MKKFNNFKEQFLAKWELILAISVGVLACSIALKSAMQPLLEFHAFRQTQTALTSYWMIQEGFKLAYETPVVGYPWSIPFEFPIYQAIVALISKLFSLPLDPTGRLVSFTFLIACALPSMAIVKRLGLRKEVAWVFCALLWSSPLYLFWGRTFMIETTAVFFGLLSIQYALDLFESSPRFKSAFLLSVFATLGMLQKVTTVGPILLVMGLAILIAHFKSSGFRLPSFKKILLVAIAFATPLIVALLWTAFSNEVKMENAFGQYLTSAALSEWNFGTLEQRMDINVWVLILVKRIAQYNVGGPLGILVFTYALIFAKGKLRTIIIVCLILFVLPIVIFTNLHLVHNYYQTACTLFLIAALTIAITSVIPKRVKGVRIIPIVVILTVGINLNSFRLIYQQPAEKIFTVESNRTLAVSDVIKRYTEPENGIVVFGNDWSSEIPYYSERKGFVVPFSFPDYDSIWKSPSSFTGDLELGAVIFVLDKDKVTLPSILAIPEIGKDGGVFEVFPECYIWLPEVKSISGPPNGNSRFYKNILDGTTMSSK